VVALLPLIVTDVLLVVGVVVVVLLGESHDWGTADAEKDERRYGLFEQGFTLQRDWTEGGETVLPE
jgi:hypothetical protein